MTVDDVRTAYMYNHWANERMLDSVSRLTPEQFTRNLGNSFPSIRDTVVHMLAAEWVWLMRWQGTSPRSMPDSTQLQDVDAIRARWKEVESEQSQLIDGLTNEQLGTVLAYTNTRGEDWKYPLWQVMQHVVNHATYHRGQVTTMLRQVGATPSPTDFLVYFDKA